MSAESPVLMTRHGIKHLSHPICVLIGVPTLMSLTKAGVQVSSASAYSFWRSAGEGLMVTEWLPS